jgi:hypothetical protein
MPMSEQYEVMETVEESIEEVVDTSVEEPELDLETNQSEEPEEEEETPDYSQADKDFLDRFEITVDKNSKKFESIEQLIEAAQMGSVTERYKDKLSKMENNPTHKWADEFMKESGYTDANNFVRDIKINTKTEELIAKGMSDEDAKSYATELVSKEMPTDSKGKEIEGFLKWHESKVSEGKIKDSLDAESIPQEVLDAYSKGQSLKEAYQDYLLDNIATTTEQDTLKKLAHNKETSAGKLADGVANSTQDMTVAQINKQLSSMDASQQSKWLDANWKVVEKSGYFK